MRQGGLVLAAGRVRSKKKKRKKKRNPAAPKTHHEIHSSPATATTSRRRATKHVPRVSPYSPASIDPVFVEIGLVQLSQSILKNTNVTHIQTEKVSNGTLYAPRYEQAFLPIGKKRPHCERFTTLPVNRRNAMNR